jgi:quinol monooxygenase YgiN
LACTRKHLEPCGLDQPAEEEKTHEALTWSAARDEANPGVFAIYDTYDDEAGRQAHLEGEAGQEFAAAVKAGELFAEAPKIYFFQVVAEK